MKPFLDENFLLETKTAIDLYEEFARRQPIVDYHCHLPPDQIADNHRFKTITEVWLNGDHYKWRAMRADGVPERAITGDASAAVRGGGARAGRGRRLVPPQGRLGPPRAAPPRHPLLRPAPPPPVSAP